MFGFINFGLMKSHHLMELIYLFIMALKMNGKLSHINHFLILKIELEFGQKLCEALSNIHY